MPLTSQDQQAIVDTHNTYRSDSAVKAPNIKWDDTLATGAQAWADNLATNVHTLKHSVAGSSRPANTGENIAAAGRLPGSLPSNPAQMVDQWGKTPGTDNNGNPAPSEQQNFKPGKFPDISKTGDWHDAGHYSQVIWGDTTSVGCGFATDSTPDANGFIWDYLVGRYSPAGNVTGVQVPKPQ